MGKQFLRFWQTPIESQVLNALIDGEPRFQIRSPDVASPERKLLALPGPAGHVGGAREPDLGARRVARGAAVLHSVREMAHHARRPVDQGLHVRRQVEAERNLRQVGAGPRDEGEPEQTAAARLGRLLHAAAEAGREAVAVRVPVQRPDLKTHTPKLLQGQKSRDMCPSFLTLSQVTRQTRMFGRRCFCVTPTRVNHGRTSSCL